MASAVPNGNATRLQQELARTLQHGKIGLAVGLPLSALNFGIYPFTKLAETPAGQALGARSVVSILVGARLCLTTIGYLRISEDVTGALRGMAPVERHPGLTRAFVGLSSGAAAFGLVRVAFAGFKGSLPATIVGAVGGATLESTMYRYKLWKEARSLREDTPNLLETLSKSRYIPLRNIPDIEYLDSLQGKLSLVNHEIKEIDEEISKVKSRLQRPDAT